MRQVARDPATFLQEYGVAVIERKLDQFPNEHEYFDQKTYEALLDFDRAGLRRLVQDLYTASKDNRDVPADRLSSLDSDE